MCFRVGVVWLKSCFASTMALKIFDYSTHNIFILNLIESFKFLFESEVLRFV